MGKERALSGEKKAKTEALFLLRMRPQKLAGNIELSNAALRNYLKTRNVYGVLRPLGRPDSYHLVLFARSTTSIDAPV